ncbi:uncharacterized protein LOC136764946 [Amia ocellicauda]|uniref:uncharacterized protein LOC136764946 n=1 Tax=Amia ocellicauda TaxID=2972642 RepID=UPI003463E3AF
MKSVTLLPLLGLLNCLHTDGSSLVLEGPAAPVLEGHSVTLQCLSDLEDDMSSVHFEKYSQYMDRWYRLDQSRVMRCWYLQVNATREPGRLVLTVSQVQSWHSGPYRCVRQNLTDNSNNNSSSSDGDNYEDDYSYRHRYYYQHSDNTPNYTDISNSISVPVHYMRDVSIYKDSNFYSRYSGQLQDLCVPEGGDVEVDCSTSASETPLYTWSREGNDWVEQSSKLKLRRVRVEDSGKYTCTASHPSVSQLRKSKTLTLIVTPEELPWLQSSQGRLVLITSVPGAVLLLLTLGLSVCLYRHRKITSKGPLDDHSQKKPIYKTSVESLPSTTMDTQPLV